MVCVCVRWRLKRAPNTHTPCSTEWIYYCFAQGLKGIFSIFSQKLNAQYFIEDMQTGNWWLLCCCVHRRRIFRRKIPFSGWFHSIWPTPIRKKNGRAYIHTDRNANEKTTREQSFGNEKMCWNSDPPCAADNLWLLRLSCWLERGTHSHSYAQIWATNKEETKFKDERLHFGSFTWFAPLPPVQMIAESLVLLVEKHTKDIQDPKIRMNVRGSENARFHVVHKEVAKRRKSHLFSAPKTRSILWMYRFVPEHVCAHQNKCATIYFTARTMLILVWARALFPSACAFECDNWNLGKHISFGE